MLESLTNTLKKHQMEIAAEKAIWMHIDAKGEQTILKAGGKHQKVPWHQVPRNYLRANGKHDLAVKYNLEKVKSNLLA